MNIMNKKTLWILLCISNNGVGMDPKGRECLVRPTQQTPTMTYDQYLSQRSLESARHVLQRSLESARQSCIQEALQLHKSIGFLPYSSVVSLLENNVSPNLLVDRGNSLLHVVGDSRTVQLLIDHGAWIERKNDRGETPFFKAMKNSYFDIARTLYASGADVNQGDKEDYTSLHDAAIESNAAKIKFLLYHGADANRRNNQNQTAGQMVGKQGRNILAAIEEYKKVFYAINATVKNNTCLTVMSLLAHNGRQLKELLMLDSSGYCSPDIVIAETLLKQCDDKIWDELASGFSPYSLEVLSLVKLVKERFNHRKCFLEALNSDDFSMAEELLQINPYLLHIYEGEYESDLANALFVEKLFSVPVFDLKYRYIKKMIHYGFNLDVRNKRGTPLLSAVIQQPNCGKKYLDLLKFGAQVNIQDSKGNTPIFYALKLGEEKMVLKLLSYGAAVNKDLCKQFSTQHSMSLLMLKKYIEQKCIRCETHDHDLSNIPCVNRHLECFICINCYNIMDQKKCPKCHRSLGVFGS